MTTTYWMTTKGAAVDGWTVADINLEAEALVRHASHAKFVVGLARGSRPGSVVFRIYREMGSHLHELMRHQVMETSEPETIVAAVENFLAYWRAE